MTDRANLEANNFKFILGVDMHETQFQHAILLVQKFDPFVYNEASTTDYGDYLQNFEIYIGDDPSWANNPKCPGGPFL